MKIFCAKPEQYLNEDFTKSINAFTSVDGETIKYIGNGSVEVEGYPQPMQVPFEIDADSIEEAFNIYEISFQEELARLEKQAKEEQNKIVTPNKEIII